MILCKDSEACPVKKLHICCKGCDELSVCADACRAAMSETPCLAMEEVQEETGIAAFQSKETAVIQAMTNILKAKAKLEEQEKEIRKQFTTAMDAYGVKSFDNGLLKVTFVPATSRKGLDSKKLQKEHPEIYDAYQKETPVKASVRISLKE